MRKENINNRICCLKGKSVSAQGFNPRITSYNVCYTKLLRFFILLGCLAGGGVLFNNLSYTKIPVYIAGSISSVTHIVSIFAARILFSEKLKLYQYLAAGISVIAIFILTSQ